VSLKYITREYMKDGKTIRYGSRNVNAYNYL
jgi:hypothetical protein